MPGEFKEEYLEAIFDLTEKGDSAKTSDIAKRMKVADASVTEMLGKLSEEGFVEYKPYHGTTLTKKGLKVATKIKRKHRLLERFLYDFLGLKKSKVHEEACRMEHALSDEAADALDEMLDYPVKCPDDGKPIPPEAPLKDGEDMLVNVKAGSMVQVVRFEGGRGLRANVTTMGIREGKKLKVVTREPAGGPLVVKTGNTTVTLGRGMASRIIVAQMK
ncbi:MAG: metal-dependent transcriptional regulator [Candidatus Altiarchaeota archaeon]